MELTEMTERVYRGSVNDIAELIAACQFSSGPNVFFLGERLPLHIIVDREERQNLLCFMYFDKKIPFALYTSGRIFSRDFELRWEKVDGKTVQAVYVGTERRLPSLDEYTLDKLNLKRKKDPTYYYLFGKRLEEEELEQIGEPAKPGDFAEVRIPCLLRYPKREGAERLCLEVYEYVEEATGEVKLFRFASLEPPKKEVESGKL